MTPSRLLLLILGGLGASLSSCAGKDPNATDDANGALTFLPNLSDFQDFQTWPSFPAGTDAVPGSVHLVGPRRVYINRVPKAGSTEFEVGTLIVKETQQADPTMRDIVARAKRGGVYNVDGATGWEWWELKINTDGKVLMLWRGANPPVGGCTYLDTTGGTCNMCHSGSTDAENVLTPALALTNFK